MNETATLDSHLTEQCLGLVLFWLHWRNRRCLCLNRATRCHAVNTKCPAWFIDGEQTVWHDIYVWNGFLLFSLEYYTNVNIGEHSLNNTRVLLFQLWGRCNGYSVKRIISHRYVDPLCKWTVLFSDLCRHLAAKLTDSSQTDFRRYVAYLSVWVRVFEFHVLVKFSFGKQIQQHQVTDNSSLGKKKVLKLFEIFSN